MIGITVMLCVKSYFYYYYNFSVDLTTTKNRQILKKNLKWGFHPKRKIQKSWENVLHVTVCLVPRRENLCGLRTLWTHATVRRHSCFWWWTSPGWPSYVRLAAVRPVQTRRSWGAATVGVKQHQVELIKRMIQKGLGVLKAREATTVPLILDPSYHGCDLKHEQLT